MNHILRSLLFAALVASGTPAATAAEYTLTQADGVIGFRLDSTLHMVNGNARQFTVKVNIPDAGAEGTITAVVTVPAKALDTGNGSRDEKMRTECLETDKYPDITFEMSAADGLPALPVNGQMFTTIIRGRLTIHGVTRETAIPVTVTRTAKGALVTGSAPVAFIKDHGIADPSVLVFRVEKTAEVFFSLTIPAPLFGAAQAATDQ